MLEALQCGLPQPEKQSRTVAVCIVLIVGSFKHRSRVIVLDFGWS